MNVEIAAWLVLYLFIGFGPGLIAGIILANRVWGRGQPTLVDIHRQNAAAAGEHNKLLDPKHPRWEKL